MRLSSRRPLGASDQPADAGFARTRRAKTIDAAAPTLAPIIAYYHESELNRRIVSPEDELQQLEWLEAGTRLLPSGRRSGRNYMLISRKLRMRS